MRILQHLAAASLLAVATLAHAAPGDDDLLAAREAFQRGQQSQLADLAPRLRSHPLYPYVEWWQLRNRLAELPREDVRQFFERHPGQLVTNRLRADWVRALARQRDWESVEREAALVVDPDTELRCLRLQARLARGDREAAREARPLWFVGREQPDACAPLFDALFASRALDDGDIWTRVRLAFQAGNATLGRGIAQRLPASQRPEQRLLDAAVKNPQKYLEARNLALRHRGDREIALFAIGRIASSTPQAAAHLWQRIDDRLQKDERTAGWAVIAPAAARKHMPEALAWYRAAGDTALDDAGIEWRARAALRAREWPELLATLDDMRAELRDTAAWRYWRARALREQGRDMEAGAILAVLAGEHNFHGLLAREDLGPAVGAPPETFKPLDEDVRNAARIPGLQRALAWYRAGLRYEGNLEWMWTVRELDDAQLLSAAELARREGWYERAIATADRTKRLTNMELRYPAPYQDLLRASARELDLDDAWVYGLVRQESRFTTSAKSSVGASGLMQVMPATAQWIARKLGLSDWRRATAETAGENVNFGTYYLKHILTQLDGSPVLASAGYNAGPRRAEIWRGSTAMEGAIYIDTIPFTETRDYVRKVMANATQYARIFGRPLDSLKQRIGIVSPRNGGTAAGQ